MLHDHYRALTVSNKKLKNEMKLFSQKEISYIKLLKEAEQVALDVENLDKEKSLVSAEEREKLI